MPYLRFSRDKRGYENTYVFHTVKEDGRSRSRMLYWFRSPPGAKVGRMPLDDAAMREIEENNPDIAFDWDRILKSGGTGRSEKVSSTAGPGRARSKRERRPSRSTSSAETVRGGEEATSSTTAEPMNQEPVSTADPEPSTGEGAEGQDDSAPAESRRGEPDAVHPVVALLGDEMLSKLRARHADLRAQLAAVEADPSRRESWQQQLERLNPDHWISMEEAVKGIEGFEADAAKLEAELTGLTDEPLV